MSSFASLFILVGTLRSLDSLNPFPFEGIINTKITILDELNFTPKYTEDFKELLAGQTFAVKVKYLAPQLLHPQPITISSNNTNVFNMDEDFWKCRIIWYMVKTAIFQTNDLMTEQELLEYKIHPLAWKQISIENKLLLR